MLFKNRQVTPSPSFTHTYQQRRHDVGHEITQALTRHVLRQQGLQSFAVVTFDQTKMHHQVLRNDHLPQYLTLGRLAQREQSF